MQNSGFGPAIKILKYAALVIAILVSISLCCNAAKVAPNVPGDTLCKAELSAQSIANFQKFLIQYGHDQLKIIEGTAFATAKGVKQNTFVVVLKCVDKDCNVYVVGVSFIKDNLTKIDIKPTGERMPSL